MMETDHWNTQWSVFLHCRNNGNIRTTSGYHTFGIGRRSTNKKPQTHVSNIYMGKDWKQYKHFCNSGYTRNIIHREPGFDLILLWSPC